jgi:glucokinase
MSATYADRENWLIADIGASNSRCAILQSTNAEPKDVQVFDNNDFASLFELLAKYIARCTRAPRHCALAVAAPVHGDEVRMINRNWGFSGTARASELGLRSVRFLNDFHAIAYALPTLDVQSRIEIGQAREYRDGSMAVLGPGSGLGMAAWIGDRADGGVMFGEGGHITMAGRDRNEDKIIDEFRQQFGHCSAERILSGSGLVALHATMHGLKVSRAEEISGNLADEKCVATMNQFFSFLGTVAAELRASMDLGSGQVTKCGA